MSLPWTEKYKARTISEVVGQNKTIGELEKFVNTFGKQKNKAVLLYGPTGSEKTEIVHSLANDYDLELIELDSSNLRNKDSIEKSFGAASQQASLLNKNKLLLADEIDALSGKDRGGVPSLIKVIKNTKYPIVLIANDPYLQKLRTLRTYCTLIKLNKLNYLAIQKKLKQICDSENVKYPETLLKKIAVSADGDIRAAINDLQTMAQGKDKITEEDFNQWSRNREESMFNALKLIFKSKDTKAALDASDELSEDLAVLNYWLDENIYKEYKKEENKKAYDFISLSDIFLSRIRKWQHWRFLVYSKALSVAGVQQAKEKASLSFIMYQRPKIMSWMFRQGAKRKKIKSDLRIAKEKLHASSSNLNKSFWPYYKFIQENNKKMAKELNEWLEIV